MHDDQSSHTNHPLGPLAPLAALAYQWQTRPVRRGGTAWAGLWHLSDRASVQQLIAQHTQRLDATTIRHLIRAGRLPGIRATRQLVALLVDEAHRDATRPTTSPPTDLDDEEPPAGIPIFDHGVLDQAKLTEAHHATHLVRHLDDFHEPTVAAIRRKLLRALADADDVEARRAAGMQAIERFLQAPTRWRDVVDMAILKRTIRHIEAALGHRVRGPRRTPVELTERMAQGIEELRATERHPAADEISDTLKRCRERLDASRVVLLYEEQRYMQLTGMVAGQSVRRHLPQGLHLIFSDQTHRRDDWTAGLWLSASDDEHQVGPYYYAQAIPEAYAAKQRRVFRVPDEGALRRYVEQDLE